MRITIILLCVLISALSSCKKIDPEVESFFSKDISKSPDYKFLFQSDIPDAKINTSWNNGKPLNGNLKVYLSNSELYYSIPKGGSILYSTIQNEKMLLLDSLGNLHYLKIKGDDISLIWKTYIYSDIESANISFNEDYIVITCAKHFVLVLDTHNGRKLWQRDLAGIVASKPVISNSRVYVITDDNQIYSLGLNSGVVQWKYMSNSNGIRYAGSRYLVLDNNKLLVPCSTGELLALDKNSGKLLWLKHLSNNAFSSFVNDIYYRPVIDGETIYIPNRSNKLIALRMQDGKTILDKDIKVKTNVWLTSSSLYFVDSKNSLYSHKQK